MLSTLYLARLRATLDGDPDYAVLSDAEAAEALNAPRVAEQAPAPPISTAELRERLVRDGKLVAVVTAAGSDPQAATLLALLGWDMQLDVTDALTAELLKPVGDADYIAGLSVAPPPVLRWGLSVDAAGGVPYAPNAADEEAVAAARALKAEAAAAGLLHTDSDVMQEVVDKRLGTEQQQAEAAKWLGDKAAADAVAVAEVP